jgi:glucokinase
MIPGTTDRPVVGIDIGGTTTEAVRVGADGRVEAHALLATRHGPDLIEGARDAVRAVLPSDGVGRIGVGVPGQVDPVAGTVAFAVNLGIDGVPVPLGERLAETFGATVQVENDTRAAALGAWRQLAPDASVLIYLGLGTGVAAGVVIDGRIHRGRDGLAGEVGHVVVDPAGPRCRCGQRGCLEVVVSGSALQARWPAGEETAATHLFKAAAGGDAAAQEVVDEVVGHLTTALTWLVVAYGADIVVLGGGVGRVGDPLLTPIRRRLSAATSRSEVAGRLFGPERVRCAPAEGPLGAVGAAALVGATTWPLGGAAARAVALDRAVPDEDGNVQQL